MTALQRMTSWLGSKRRRRDYSFRFENDPGVSPAEAEKENLIELVERRGFESWNPHEWPITSARGNETFNLVKRDRYIFLEPFRTDIHDNDGTYRRMKWVLPVLATIFGKPEQDRPFNLSLQIAFFTSGDVGQGERLVARAYRFETPSGGAHDYHHAQFITGFFNGRKALPCPAWTPTKWPAFVIDANNAVVLYLTLLYGLEGGREIVQEMLGHRELKDLIRGFIDDRYETRFPQD